MKKGFTLQEREVKIFVSGPLKMVVGREIRIPYKEGLTIKDVVQHISKIYSENTGKGHNKFEDLFKQLVIYIDGIKWNKKDNVVLMRGSRVDIVHLINGG